MGLGLIGGSMARVFSAGSHTVLAADLDSNILEKAQSIGAVHGILDERTVSACDLLLLAIYPGAAIATLQRLAPHIKKNTLVMDLCGTKRQVCEACFAIAKEYGFGYVGGHPMAGTQFSGFDKSRADLFVGAPMVLVPPTEAQCAEGFTPEALLERSKELLAPVGFGSFATTTARDHDRVIAFTSQLAHVVSNAYVKSPRAQVHHGFSAGSYKDLTRVAWLNETMWSELFLENRDFLAEEIDHIVTALEEYKDALEKDDASRLTALLLEGRLAKEKADKAGEYE